MSEGLSIYEQQLRRLRFLYPNFKEKMLNDLAKVLGCTVDELPKVFKSDLVQVLKIGVFKDLLTRYPNVNTDKLQRWMFSWTHTMSYKSATTFTANRYDLDGNVVDLINDEDKARARVQLERKVALAKEKRLKLSEKRKNGSTTITVSTNSV